MVRDGTAAFTVNGVSVPIICIGANAMSSPDPTLPREQCVRTASDVSSETTDFTAGGGAEETTRDQFDLLRNGVFDSDDISQLTKWAWRQFHAEPLTHEHQIAIEQRLTDAIGSQRIGSEQLAPWYYSISKTADEYHRTGKVVEEDHRTTQIAALFLPLSFCHDDRMRNSSDRLCGQEDRAIVPDMAEDAVVSIQEAAEERLSCMPTVFALVIAAAMLGAQVCVLIDCMLGSIVW